MWLQYFVIDPKCFIKLLMVSVGKQSDRGDSINIILRKDVSRLFIKAVDLMILQSNLSSITVF